MNRFLAYQFIVLSVWFGGFTQGSWADGLGVDKIYHPYVQPLEKEIELRFITADPEGESKSVQQYLLAYGQSINDRWFAEIYVVAEKLGGGQIELAAYELEAKWQLTEQGEYSADFALLFELEQRQDIDIWEFATALIVEKEWGRWSGTANAFVISEWGDDIDNELETKLNLQARYRYSASLEPALELYMSQDTKGIGPAFLGQLHLAGRQQIKWEAGLIMGLDAKTPDATLRLLMEYEF
ncbi:hypothetical protein [Dasania marina]|uniref:hypothetical protein n=1 Tax=Dasania marina TaxID=471499 RepID=UPI000379A6BA|nr:hypothetical protein [Dasania marina]